MNFKSPVFTSECLSKHRLTVFESSLKRKGYKLIGEGAYAKVYARPHERFVYKIGKSIEDAWLKWANAVTLKPDPNLTKNTPKIFFVKIYGDSGYVAKIERLRRTPSSSEVAGNTKREIADVIMRVFQSGASLDDVITVARIVALLKKHKVREHSLDLHAENILYRGVDWVLSDPLA